MKSIVHALATCVIALGSSACSDDDDAGGGSTVSITLQEDTVTASPASAPAGEVTFNVRNIGMEVHEFVVVKTDLPEAQLPMANGQVDEAAAGMTVIGEIEDVPAGGAGSVKLQMAAGKHVLICNVVEAAPDGAVIANHYAEGMHTAFLVQ